MINPKGLCFEAKSGRFGELFARWADAGLARPVDQSEIRQLSIVTSNKTDTDMNAPEDAARAKAGGATGTSQSSGVTASGPTHRVAPGNDDRTHSHPPQALDRWFDEQLNRLFNDVSSEPLPTDLAKLVSELRAQGNKPNDK